MTEQETIWLVVEDDPSLRAMLSAMVDIWGRVPLTFQDGNEAMAWLDKVEAGDKEAAIPELALLDVRMPGPQGHEIGERLRKLRPEIPVVMMTAFRLESSEMDEIIERAKPDKVVKKPLPAAHELKEILEQVVADRKAQLG